MSNEIKNYAKERYGIIYIIRNKINNKMYIGQTTRENGFDDRYQGNIERVTDNSHLKNSIKKYGIENFEIDKEFDIAYSKEELDKLEDMYIKLYNTINRNLGYNKKTGGSVGILCNDSKNKISESLKVYFKTYGNPNKGRKHTIESRKRMSEIQKGRYLGEDAHNSRAVICITAMQKYTCGVDACGHYNMSPSALSECCSGNREFGGRCKETGIQLRWMYLDEWNKLTDKEKEFHVDKPVCKDGSKVICVNTGDIFDSSTEAAKICLGTHINAIGICCKNKRGTCGKNKNGTPLRWMYLYDWNKLTDEEKILEINKEVNILNRIKIYCVTTKEVFNGVEEAGINYNIAATSISHAARNFGKKSAGKLKDGKPLSWMYLEEWNKLEEKVKDEFTKIAIDYKTVKAKGKKVICITTGLTFNMAKDGAEYYGIDSSSIVKCCKGKLSKCGNLPDGTPLVWRYLNEYLQTA